MKIVVYQVGPDSWRWVIRDGTTSNHNMAVGLRWYTRKSDAKRGAQRFEERLFQAYLWADNKTSEDGCMLNVEVLD